MNLFTRWLHQKEEIEKKNRMILNLIYTIRIQGELISKMLKLSGDSTAAERYEKVAIETIEEIKKEL